MKLLYKIDLILFWGDCCYGLEVMVKMALVKKTAFQGNLRQIHTLPQKLFCQFYSAVQAIRMRCYAYTGFKLSEQRVRIDPHPGGQLFQGKVHVQICA